MILLHKNRVQRRDGKDAVRDVVRTMAQLAVAESTEPGGRGERRARRARSRRGATDGGSTTDRE